MESVVDGLRRGDTTGDLGWMMDARFEWRLDGVAILDVVLASLGIVQRECCVGPHCAEKATCCVKLWIIWC